MVLERRDLDLIVEVADVANNRHVLHLAHVLDADHVFVASCGDENISGVYNIFEQNHFKAVHRRLERTNRINFGDLYTRASTRK